MLVECIRDFKDKAAGVMRQAGEQYDVDEERFAALNATRYGQLVKAVEEQALPEPQPEQEVEPQPEPEAEKPKGGRLTKAELLDKAEALGIEVPKGATNKAIADLIAEAGE